MQLMPQTAASLGVNPDNLGQNALGGAELLKSLLNQFGQNLSLALAAYNAGPGAVAQYGGVPPYAQTQQYVADVLSVYKSASPATTPAATPANSSWTG
jgi:soluble lytic murein transglycosylase-like protein